MPEFPGGMASWAVTESLPVGPGTVPEGRTVGAPSLRKVGHRGRRGDRAGPTATRLVAVPPVARDRPFGNVEGTGLVTERFPLGAGSEWTQAIDAMTELVSVHDRESRIAQVNWGGPRSLDH